MNTINFSEAKQDAERLSRVTHRDVEAVPVTCDCDYSKSCGKCGGEGTYHEPRFVFCGHTVPEGPDEDCEQNDCQWKEYQAFCKRDEERESVTA